MNSTPVLLIANHLWQSTLFTASAALLTLTLRENSARVRHWVWLAASCKFLIPFSILIALGGHLGWLATSKANPSSLPVVMDQVVQPFVASTGPVALAAPVARAATLFPAFLAGIWLCGFLGITCSWYVRWRRIRIAVSGGSQVDLGLSIPTVCSPSLMEPAVFGFIQPILLLPDGIFERVTPGQLNAIVEHELCHVHHRDNLAAAIHMFVETVFWFHPLVWWMGKQMVEERERACDEEVLRTLREPASYAEAILNVCKLYLESPVACVSGITGSNLKRRIEEILRGATPHTLTVARKTLLASAGFVALSTPIAVGLLDASAGRAQQPAPAASLPRFEVASIKRSPPNSHTSLRLMPGGGISASGTTLKVLLQTAFDLAGFQVTGWPSWLFDEKFEILAKGGYAGEPSKEKTHLMMQAFLADRFKLRYHYEAKELPVYVLSIAGDGPKLKETRDEDPGLEVFKQPDGSKGEGIRGTVPVGALTAQRASMEMLAAFLKGLTGREVINETALRGRYDFKMEWSSESTPSLVAGVADPVPDDPRPSIFTAVQQQLGLSLKASKGPVQILVIDQVEKPSEN